jgi:lipoprotein-anchoring transpeptidase ErfK/SrfK
LKFRTLLIACLAIGAALPTQAALAAPLPASMTVRVTGIKNGKVQIFDRVGVRGTLTPNSPGEQVELRLVDGDKTVQRKAVGVHSGAFKGKFKIDRDGSYRVLAVHDASAALAAASAQSKHFGITYPALRLGSKGPAVKLFNRLLQNKGYIASDGSTYNATTGRGVMAFRKVNFMRRTFATATPQMFKTLANDRGGYTLVHPEVNGRHAEVSLRRQVLVLANSDKVFRIYHVSTGAPATPTIRGTFNFIRRTPGTNAKGMVNAFYFHGGYAVHGYKSVPAFPASHGCVRTPIPDHRGIYNWLQYGDSISIY